MARSSMFALTISGLTDIGSNFKHKNSIAFGSAPRREVDSQPISQLDRPAVCQIETHTLGFLLVADTLSSSRDDAGYQNRW